MIKNYHFWTKLLEDFWFNFAICFFKFSLRTNLRRWRKQNEISHKRLYTHLKKLSPASQLIIHAFTSLNFPFTFSKRFTPIITSHAHTGTKLFQIIIANLCFLLWMFYKNDYDHLSPANAYILNRKSITGVITRFLH